MSLNNFIYAMDKSFDNMCQVISDILNKSDYTEKDRQELFFGIGTCLHWILDCAERLEISKEDKQYFSAFRYVNNSLKHSFEIKEISAQRGGLVFPLVFPLVIPKRKVVWSVSADEKYENQKYNYNENLKGKDVILTCEKAIAILKNCNLKNAFKC